MENVVEPGLSYQPVSIPSTAPLISDSCVIRTSSREPGSSASPDPVPLTPTQPGSVPSIQEETSQGIPATMSDLTPNQPDTDGSQAEPSGPPADIRDALEAAIKTSEKLHPGSFYFEQTYTDSEAIDPVLRVDGHGRVALPLSSVDAKKLITHGKQAPFGMNERTIVDTNVRHTWELDAAAAHIDHPGWEDYLGGIMRQVCHALGISYEASHPVCELHKLLIYETGSHFSPHQDSEKADGMVASVIIVLPSPFTGGAVHLSHRGKAVDLDSSPASSHKTTVLAWFTDVTHGVKPVTSGYRLALSYNLIRTKQELRPHFPAPPSLLDSLRHILRSWQQRDDASPFRIMYLLQHRYSQANLRGGSLKGHDAFIASLLNDLALELNFSIALTLFDYFITGYGDDSMDFSEEGGGNYGTFDETTVKMVGNGQAYISFEGVVDFDGSTYGKKVLALASDWNEGIPANFREVIEKESDYTQRAEPYYGNEGGTVERQYRRTALLLWPELHNVELDCEGDFSTMLEALKNTRSPVPTEEESRKVSYLLRGACSERVPRDEVTESVCQTAIRWGNLDLWHSTATAWQGDRKLGPLTQESICEAVQHLGFEGTRAVIESILRNEPNNLPRFERA